MAQNPNNELRSEWWSRPLGHAIYCGIILISKTLRFKVSYANPELEKNACTMQFIAALWHNRTFVPCYIYTRLMRSTRKMCMITSASKDGALLTAVAEDFGMMTVRGSSHRRGVRAFLEMVKAMKKGACMCLSPDGPRGPMYKCKPGTIKLASLTGVPIVPATLSFSSYWRVKSWDQYIIPKPFSKVELHWCEPIHVPRDLSDEQLEQYQEHLNYSLSIGTPDFEDASSDDDHSQIK